MTLHEDFSSGALDETVWFPYYLPHWSSRSEAAATFDVSSGALHLSIPPEQPLWCPDRHEEPMKVSCIQTGSFSGAKEAAVSPLGLNDDELDDLVAFLRSLSDGPPLASEDFPEGLVAAPVLPE